VKYEGKITTASPSREFLEVTFSLTKKSLASRRTLSI